MNADRDAAAVEAAVEAAVDAAVNRAVALFDSGCNCAESVLEALTGFWGLEPARAAATVLGGGMAGSGYVCGALVGGLLAIGLRRGPLDAADRDGRRAATTEARELLAWFSGRSQSVMCRDITGCDLRTSEGSARMRDEDIKAKRCLPLVRDAVRHLAGRRAEGGRV